MANARSHQGGERQPWDLPGDDHVRLPRDVGVGCPLGMTGGG